MSTVYEYFFIVFPLYGAKLLYEAESSVCSVAVGAGTKRDTRDGGAFLSTHAESRRS